MPRTAALVAELRAAGVAAVVSGAGPSVLALTTPVQRKELIDAPTRRGWSVLALDVDREGAVTLPLARAEAG
jgi:homoserine kinase